MPEFILQPSYSGTLQLQLQLQRQRIGTIKPSRKSAHNWTLHISKQSFTFTGFEFSFTGLSQKSCLTCLSCLSQCSVQQPWHQRTLQMRTHLETCCWAMQIMASLPSLHWNVHSRYPFCFALSPIAFMHKLLQIIHINERLNTYVRLRLSLCPLISALISVLNYACVVQTFCQWQPGLEATKHFE